MNKKTTEVLKEFCADKMNAEEAAHALNMSEEDFLRVADEYDYTPTVEEVREANKIVQTAYNRITSRALKKLEIKAREKILVPQTISIPTSNSFFHINAKINMMMYPTIQIVKVYRPLGLKSTFWEQLIERARQKKRGQLGVSRAKSNMLFTTYSYSSERGNQMPSFEDEPKFRVGA